MTGDREAICVALLALFRAKPGGFVTVGRRHIMPPLLQPAQQPALFVAQTMEETKQPNQGMPGITVMEATLFVYLLGPGVDEPAGEETTLAETALNALLADIEAALDSGSDPAQTLGGLVYDCWIEGQAFKDPGILGNQAMAIVPVRMLVP